MEIPRSPRAKRDKNPLSASEKSHHLPYISSSFHAEVFHISPERLRQLADAKSEIGSSKRKKHGNCKDMSSVLTVYRYSGCFSVLPPVGGQSLYPLRRHTLFLLTSRTQRYHQQSWRVLNVTSRRENPYETETRQE